MYFINILYDKKPARSSCLHDKQWRTNKTVKTKQRAAIAAGMPTSETKSN